MALGHGPTVVTSGLILALDAADKNSYPVKNFVSSKIYSVFNGSLRSANYTVQYSDDNTNWTTAFSGVSSNNTSCGIQQNTGSGDGSYGFHRYWRYVEGSAVTLHHPRVSRIILTDVNGVDYNLVVYTSDNCSDSGTYIVGTVSLDFGGTTWTDLSGNGNNGTFGASTAAPTYNSANGGSLVFDGSNDRVIIPTRSLGNGNLPWTCTVWMKTTTTASTLGSGSILSNSSGGPVYSMMGVNNGKIVYWTYYSSAWQQKLGVGKTVNDGIWHCLSWVNYSNYTMDMYVDGSLDSNVANSTSGNNNPIDIIGSSWTAAFPGNIAQVQIYNRALTAAEVSQNFNALRGRFGI